MVVGLPLWSVCRRDLRDVYTGRLRADILSHALIGSRVVFLSPVQWYRSTSSSYNVQFARSKKRVDVNWDPGRQFFYTYQFYIYVLVLQLSIVDN